MEKEADKVLFLKFLFPAALKNYCYQGSYSVNVGKTCKLRLQKVGVGFYGFVVWGYIGVGILQETTN